MEDYHHNVVHITILNKGQARGWTYKKNVKCKGGVKLPCEKTYQHCEEPTRITFNKMDFSQRLIAYYFRVQNISHLITITFIITVYL